MRVLYLELGMGAAGDMLAAALTELLPDPEGFVAELNNMGIPGVVFERETVVRCGITGTHMKVTVNGAEEESLDTGTGHVHEHFHEHQDEQEHGHRHENCHEHQDEQEHGYCHEHFHGYGTDSDQSHDCGQDHGHDTDGHEWHEHFYSAERGQGCNERVLRSGFSYTFTQTSTHSFTQSDGGEFTNFQTCTHTGDDNHDDRHQHEYGLDEGHTHSSFRKEDFHDARNHHGHGHPHHHSHSHHHRSMADIEHIVRGHLGIPDAVKDTVMEVYRLIAEAESYAHGKPVEEIHFHEVGTLDAIADITAVCLLMHRLSPDEVVASPVHVGSGSVRCAHGILPVPAPATAFILRDVPIYGGAVRGELCTPTGAALIKTFVASFGGMPVMRTERIGYGMGKKDFEQANCVRAFLGESFGTREAVNGRGCSYGQYTGGGRGAEPCQGSGGGHGAEPCQGSGSGRGAEPSQSFGSGRGIEPCQGSGGGRGTELCQSFGSGRGAEPCQGSGGGCGIDQCQYPDNGFSTGQIPDSEPCFDQDPGSGRELMDTVCELSCNLDDMTPEALGFAMEVLLGAGALDVYTVPIGMKKSRPGVLLGVLCREADTSAIVKLIFRHTTTLGIRENIMRRFILSRETIVHELPAEEIRGRLLHKGGTGAWALYGTGTAPGAVAKDASKGGADPLCGSGGGAAPGDGAEDVSKGVSDPSCSSGDGAAPGDGAEDVSKGGADPSCGSGGGAAPGSGTGSGAISMDAITAMKENEDVCATEYEHGSGTATEDYDRICHRIVREKRSFGYGVTRSKYEYADLANIAAEAGLTLGEVVALLRKSGRVQDN